MVLVGVHIHPPGGTMVLLGPVIHASDADSEGAEALLLELAPKGGMISS